MNITFEYNGLNHSEFAIEDAMALGVPNEVIQAAIDAQIAADAKNQVNDIADRIYTRSVSRGSRYEQKYAEAKAYKAAGYPMPVDTAVYMYMQDESQARGLTPEQFANSVIAVAEAFNAFGGKAEAALVKCRTSVEAIPLGNDVNAAIALKKAAAKAVVDEIKALVSLSA